MSRQDSQGTTGAVAAPRSRGFSMTTYYYEVVDEDSDDDLTTVSVARASDDELFEFSLPGIFNDDEPGSLALEDAILARLITDGEATERDRVEPEVSIEEGGEFDDGEDDDDFDDDDFEDDDDDDEEDE